jgi:NAD(P)-dependent dehydrogenase (short-subunit alcohol dehydrogenase family)
MPRRISDSVVVITGASSGIGRATAIAFAEEGASVVLAARREEPLLEVAAACEAAGGRALAIPTDVTDEEAVKELARRATEHFGRIDVWVNNAAVGVFGRFEETPPEVYRRVIETDLFGTIYGARAALPYLREQGSGVLINNASMVAKVAQPYTSAYSISKHGVRALGESLRQELLLDGARDIHVCTVMPATIDTPFFRHAANYTGRGAKAMPPVYPAEKVAKTIVGCAERPRREVFVGTSATVINLQHTLAPGLTERSFARMVDSQHLADEPAPPNPGAAFEPMPGTGVSGGWEGRKKTRARRAATAGLAAAAVSVPVIWAYLRVRRP